MQKMEVAHWEYLLERQCAPQWRGFLEAMSTEFAAQLPTDDLRMLARKIGVRFAKHAALPECRSLDDMRAAVNAIWSASDWGFVDMDEGDGHVRLVHRYAPLKAAFGEDALAWSPAYLEGVYQQWFMACGAGNELGVKQASEYDANGAIEYRLSL